MNRHGNALTYTSLSYDPGPCKRGEGALPPLPFGRPGSSLDTVSNMDQVFMDIHKYSEMKNMLIIDDSWNTEYHVIMLCRRNIATWPEYMGIGRDA